MTTGQRGATDYMLLAELTYAPARNLHLGLRAPLAVADPGAGPSSGVELSGLKVYGLYKEHMGEVAAMGGAATGLRVASPAAGTGPPPPRGMDPRTGGQGRPSERHDTAGPAEHGDHPPR